MKIMVACLFLITVVLVSSCTDSSKPPSGFVQVKGTKLLDQRGREFFIRGIGLGNWMLPEGYMWQFTIGKADRPRTIEKLIADLIGKEKADQFWVKFRETFITEADIERIAQTGFNTIRLPFNYKLFMEEGSGTNLKAEGFELTDKLISWCKKYHILVVLDMHAAPGGQTGRNIDDSEHDQPELFLNPLYWKKAVMLWKTIAERYKDEPTVLAYDLLNEPLPIEGQFIELTNRLEPFYREVTAAIREVDPNHIITIEGARWATEWSIFSKPFDKNLLYQFHKYWNATDQASIQTYLDFRKKWNVPVWCGETGENNIKWYRESFGLLEKQKIGWAFWTWKRLENMNSVYSIIQPSYWSDITMAAAYGIKCSPQKAEIILSNFLENCKIENCVTNDFVIKSVFLKR